ncbi:MAG: hypothetical protein H6727_12340 [Myxococcales bacterium]|nr:hypothetical protein [Myxococcales bacterium]
MTPFWNCTPPLSTSETTQPDVAGDGGTTPTEPLPERAPLPDRKPPKVGTLCSTQEDCATGLTCETQVPQGYCTKFCNHTRECPLYSACARITFEGGFQLQRCIRTCRDERDCREGYVCYGPPNEWDQICVPPIP